MSTNSRDQATSEEIATSCMQRTVLSTAAPFKGFQSFLFDTDGLTFVVDNEANTHVCQDKSLFVRDISDSRVSLDTASGVNGPLLQVGRIKISWLDDDSVLFEYILDDVIYNQKNPIQYFVCGAAWRTFW